MKTVNLFSNAIKMRREQILDRFERLDQRVGKWSVFLLIADDLAKKELYIELNCKEHFEQWLGGEDEN